MFILGWREICSSWMKRRRKLSCSHPSMDLNHYLTLPLPSGNNKQSSSVRDLGVIYDQHLNMSHHVHSVCRTGYYHLRNIGRIRRYLTLDATKTIVHALVTSRLDYCNLLLYGLPANHLVKMQCLQNACTRVITRTGRRSHITPVLKELHWLPVHQWSTISLQTYTLFTVRINHPVDRVMNQNCNVWRQNFYESSGDSMEQFAC